MNTETTIAALEEAKNLILSMVDEKADLVAQVNKLLAITPDGDVKQEVQKAMEWYKA